MSLEVIQKVVADYFAATRSMDIEAWLGTFAEDAVSYEPDSLPLKGHADLSQFFQNIAGAFEKVGLTEENVFIADNQAAVKWVGRGIGKNGREVIFEGIDVFQMNEAGKIQTIWAYWNPSAMMAQLQS
ncbi:MAG: nuclear transport factor 2 family protein [Heteroscytonema crispum UTEX LB 1556]